MERGTRERAPYFVAENSAASYALAVAVRALGASADLG